MHFMRFTMAITIILLSVAKLHVNAQTYELEKSLKNKDNNIFRKI